MRNILALVALAVTALVSDAGGNTRININSGHGYVPRPVVPIRGLNSGYSNNANLLLDLNLNSGYNNNALIEAQLRSLRAQQLRDLRNLQALQSQRYYAPPANLTLNLGAPQYCTPAQTIILNLQGGYNTRNLNGGCRSNGTPNAPVVPGIVP